MKDILEIIGMILIYGIVILAVIGIPVLTVKLVDRICGDKKNTTPPKEKEVDTENGEAETTEEYPYIKGCFSVFVFSESALLFLTIANCF